MNRIIIFLILVISFASCNEKVSSRVIQAYSNGQIKTEADFIEEGKTKVAQRTFLQNGNLLSEGPMNDNRRDGLWTFYDYEGNIKSKRNYSAGKYNGLYQEFDSNGQLVLEGNYDNGQRVGDWNSQGEKQSEEPDLVNRQVIEKYEDGKVKTEIVYDEEGTSKMSQVSYYNSGEVLMRGNFKNGLKEGEWTAFFKSGRRQSINYYREDRYHGDYMLYMENGQVMIEGEYNFGNQTGSWFSYDENGQLISQKFYDSEGYLLDETK